MKARLVMCVLLATSGCGPAAPPLISQAEVQQFVRDYVAATNAADAAKLMSMVQRDAAVSSIAYGKLDRGWEAIRTSTDQGTARSPQFKMTTGTVDVMPLAPDTALVVATMNLAGQHQIGGVSVLNLPGAFTMVVRRTPEGLRLVHEHYSVRAP